MCRVTDALFAVDDLAALVMRQIMYASYIETIELKIITATLNSEFVIVSQVMSRAFARKPKAAAIIEALKIARPATVSLFSDLWEWEITKVGAKRDEFAHSWWAASYLIPDALILVPPAAELELHARERKQTLEMMASIIENPTAPPGLLPVPNVDPSKAWVYERAELVTLVGQAAQAHFNAGLFLSLVELRPTHEAASKLSSALRIGLDRRHPRKQKRK
jgi:hypothetical protein